MSNVRPGVGVECCGRLRDDRWCGSCGRKLGVTDQPARPGHFRLGPEYCGGVAASIRLNAYRLGDIDIALSCVPELPTLSYIVVELDDQERVIVSIQIPEGDEGDTKRLHEFVAFPPAKIGPVAKED